MTTRRIRMDRGGAGDEFWNNHPDGNRELICHQGLMRFCEVPRKTKVIWACISDKQPRHNHWFRYKHEKYVQYDKYYYSVYGYVDFSDDELGPIEMDMDFDRWLRDSPPGYQYLWFEYEEKS